jgi:hypothetical protein
MRLPDQEPAALVLVQVKLLDGYSLGRSGFECRRLWRPAWLGGGPLFDPFQSVSERAAFRLEFEAILQVHPELGGRAEVAAEPQRRVGGDATLSVREPLDPRARHVDGCRQAIGGQAERPEKLLAEHLSRVQRRQLGH